MDRDRNKAKVTRTRIALASALCAAGLAGCSLGPGSSSGSIEPSGPGAMETVVDELDAPWSVAWYQDAALISERDTGRILEVVGDGTREVGVVPDVVSGGEGGLLGLAVEGNDLFVYSGGPDGNRIQRFPLTGSPGSVGIGEPVTILDDLPQSGNHNGGRIAFGPDGLLYATVGDAGDRDQAQDPKTLGGTIVRLTRDGEIPSDNPFDDSPVYSYGHRNPQGLAWAEDGTMYAAEFGQDTWDELNVIEAGKNYGWPETEGRGGGDDFVDPVAQWSTDEASPSAIAIQGQHLYVANLGGESLTRLDLSDPQESTTVVNTVGRVREVTFSPDNELLILTNNTDGRGTPGDRDDELLKVSTG